MIVSNGSMVRNTKRVMNRTSNGTPGTDANSIIKAEAIAAHILYNLTVDKFTFTRHSLRDIN
jgi:hypothetical protein